ncbi:MAG: NUDIX hydrolase [Gammaproteobacteria bacterium]|nr:NUDIX hydrolase [Gammaproteobacteria bacterium]MDH3467744.1 NUDIX hydrolase [Gammaproteobacteria bacterium]
MPVSWFAHVTVAAIVEDQGRYLLVEETVNGNRVLNQPAGHLDPGESLFNAVVRETHEETGLVFNPDGLVGIYESIESSTQQTFLRIAFTGSVVVCDNARPVDQNVHCVLWATPEEIRAQQNRLRSAYVLLGIEDHLCGRRYPLEFLRQLPDRLIGAATGPR